MGSVIHQGYTTISQPFTAYLYEYRRSMMSKCYSRTWISISYFDQPDRHFRQSHYDHLFSENFRYIITSFWTLLVLDFTFLSSENFSEILCNMDFELFFFSKISNSACNAFSRYSSMSKSWDSTSQQHNFRRIRVEFDLSD